MCSDYSICFPPLFPLYIWTHAHQEGEFAHEPCLGLAVVVAVTGQLHRLQKQTRPPPVALMCVCGWGGVSVDRSISSCPPLHAVSPRITLVY